MKLKVIVLSIILLAWACPVRAEGNLLKDHNLGDWKVDFGIEERLRYEYKSDFDFNDDAGDDGSLFFNRVRLSSKFSLEDKYEVFIEGLDARVGSHGIAKPAQADDLDLYQAYLKINGVFDSDVSLKLGRQQLNYGKGRLVAAPTWANRMNSFDAVVLRYADAPFSCDLLGGFNVKYDDNNPNHSIDDEMLNGVYIGYQKDKKAPLLEVYDLNLLDNKISSSHIQIYTIGARIQDGLWDGFGYDLEIPCQFGESGTKDIKAYAFHLDLSQSFDAVLKPKVTLDLNLASGDGNSGDNEVETFTPLYQTTHAPYGIMDFFRWQNMREIAPGLTITPGKKLQLTGGANFFWLDDEHDSWYNSSGTKLMTAPATQDVSSFVGTETSLTAKYDLTKEIQLEAGYAHFFTGSYGEDMGSDDDADWFYSQVTLKF